jgi:UDP-glucose 4-epimerase
MGSHLVDHLIDRLGHDVVVLDDLSGGFADNVHAGARFVEGSILDEPLVESLFRDERFDQVFHLAAYAAEGLSHFIKRFNYRNNLIGSVNLVNASINHGVSRFVFTSSIAVYGAGQIPMSEDRAPRPEDPYGIAKYAVEQELRVSQEMFGLDYVIFRPHNVYGERQNLGDRYRNVVGIFMNKLMSGEDLLVFGDGTQRRAFTYVGDIIPAIAAAGASDAARNRVFNAGADHHCSVAELAEEVMKATGIQGRLRFEPARHEVHTAFSDHSRFHAVFPDVVETPLAEGLRRMAEWAKRTGVRTSAEFGDIEIERNLPVSWRPSR